METSNTPAERFVTTVDLSIKFEENTNQFIYASQLYGTLFGIYANFKCAFDKQKPVTINSIWFKLINYKGCVNMGLVDVEHHFDNVIKKNTISLFVKPLHSSACPFKFDFENGGLAISDFNEIVFERKVYPYDHRITRESDSGNSQNSIFFDEEFNYRDGLYEISKPFRPGHSDMPESLASQRCHQSNVMLKY